jgi:pantoate kinase
MNNGVVNLAVQQEESLMTPEGKVKAKVKKVLKEINAYYITPATGGYGNSGAPDFIVAYRGKFFGIECKANDNKATALQMHHLCEIRRCGGIGLVINEANVDTLSRRLEDE